MAPLKRAGHGWCDVVALPQGGFAWVYSVPGGFVCENNHGVKMWEQQVEGMDHPRYIDAVATPQGNVVAIGVGANNVAWAVSAIGKFQYGIVHGQNPVALDIDERGEVRIYLMRTPKMYTVNGVPQTVPLADPDGTSQGFRDVVDGVIAWADLSHMDVFNGVELHQWVRRGEIIAGQIDGSDRIDVVFDNKRFTVIPTRTIAGPKVARQGGVYAICAPTVAGAELIVCPPWPEVIDIPPLPPPPPPPPPPHGEIMFLPDYIKDTRARYVDRFPIPQTPGGGDAHEERCRQWSIRFAQQVVHERPNEGWGTKRADANRPVSKDSIARLLGGKLWSWDLLVGTGTGTPTLNPDPRGEEISDQVFVPVVGIDYLGGIVPPPQQHAYDGGDNDTGSCDICGKPKNDAIHLAVPPPPSDDLAAVVRQLQEQMTTLQARVDVLANRPPSTGVDEERVDQLMVKKLRTLRIDGDVKRSGGFLPHDHTLELSLTLDQETISHVQKAGRTPMKKPKETK